MYIWYVTIIHAVLAILLFFLVNWLGRYSKPLGYMQMSVSAKEDTAPFFNYLFKVLAPVVYIVLLSAIFEKMGIREFNVNIYMIVIEYWAFRFLYVTILGHLMLLDWTIQIFYWISSIGLAVWFQSMVDKVDTILLDSKNLVDELWLLIIVFLYSIINKMKFAEDATERRKKNYITYNYKKFDSRFGSIVRKYSKNDLVEVIAFSIMIYESFNRPQIARRIERFVFRNSPDRHSFGIMQVMSDKVLTDEESIKLGIEKIVESLSDYKEDTQYCNCNIYISSVVYHIAREYNVGNDYGDEVRNVFEVIRDTFYHTIKDQYTVEEYKEMMYGET